MIKEKDGNELGDHLGILSLRFPQELKADSLVQLTYCLAVY